MLLNAADIIRSPALGIVVTGGGSFAKATIFLNQPRSSISIELAQTTVDDRNNNNNNNDDDDKRSEHWLLNIRIEVCSGVP